jgi:hypothetical protein
MTTPAHRDAEESRDARDRPLRQHWSHPIDCRCRQCLLEDWDPAEEQW